MRATITLPFPPSVNAYWGYAVRGGRGRQFVEVYPTAAAKAYRAAVQAVVLREWGVLRRNASRLALLVVAHPPDRRKRDIDNLLKAVLDSLTEARVWIDDEQVDRIEIERGAIRKGGALVVTIEKRPDEQRGLFE